MARGLGARFFRNPLIALWVAGDGTSGALIEADLDAESRHP
jgi:hypothetical protein